MMFSWLFGKLKEQPNTLAMLEELNEVILVFLVFDFIC